MNNSLYKEGCHYPETFRWLNGKTALITGATSGIGHALSLAMHKCGANVIVHGRSRTKVDSIIKGKAGMEGIVGNLENEEGWRIVEKRIGMHSPDILVLNAGYNLEKKLASELTDQEIVNMLKVNLVAPIRSARTFAGLPKQKDYRKLVLILSTSCFHPRNHMSLYIAAKAGLMGFGKVLQQEMHELGIRTLLLYPGRTDTSIRDCSHPEYMSPDSVASATIALLCLPDDVVPYEFIFRPPVDTRI